MGNAVLDLIGRPDDLARLDVRPLWGDRYRINVWRETRGGPRLTHSYFVVSDGRQVSRSEPPANRAFWDDLLDSCRQPA